VGRLSSICQSVQARNLQTIFLSVAILLAMVFAASLKNTSVAAETNSAIRVHVYIDVPIDGNKVGNAFFSELKTPFNLSTQIVTKEGKAANPLVGITLPEKFLDYDVRVVVAAGASACRTVLASQLDVDIVCTLLTAQAFRFLIEDAKHSHPDNPPWVSRLPFAVVLDQPVSRQLAVSRAVYPALKRFVALLPQDEEEAEFHTQFGEANFSNSEELLLRRYDSSRPLSDQLASALSNADAAIAIPDNQIYNRSTLRTTLLTTYSEGKPVIGFNRAYVRAGALVSAYATHRHMAREVRRLIENIDSKAPSSVSADGDRPELQIKPTTEFSVTDNESIARSLGLFRSIALTPNKDFTDGDFMP